MASASKGQREFEGMVWNRGFGTNNKSLRRAEKEGGKLKKEC